MPRKLTLSEELRRAIQCSGKTFYALSQESGVDHAALSRFVAGARGLTTPSVDKLAKVLGLKLETIK